MSTVEQHSRPSAPPGRPEAARPVVPGWVERGADRPADPREAADFAVGLWPLCNGGAAPEPGTTDSYERRCLDFLGAYYRVNLANAAILATRSDSNGPERERDLRAALVAAVRELELIEDQHAPIGFFGDPTMNGPYYADIRFVRPGIPKHPAGETMATPFLPVLGLHEIPEAELRGTPIIRRWRHGQTHS